MKFHKILIAIASTLFILLVVTITNTNSLNLDVGNAHIFSGPKDSYFGYSVAFVKNGKGEKWILIGAPRANDSFRPSLTEPGGLFRCQRDLKPTECSFVPINTESTSGNWMGVSIDVGQQLILVCGHRWISANYNMNGICVELGRDFAQSRARKYLVDPDMQTINDTLIYSIGAMGMSCAYAPTGESRTIEKAIGAPGIYEATGGVVKHTDFDQATDVVHFPTLRQTEAQLYGYAVTFGKLYGGDDYNMITGGPRDSMTGQVKILMDKANNFDLKQQIPGEQVGSYFGSAIATTPLQTGEPEYLLVGAPMYAGFDRNNWNIVEEIGKVYVYKYDSADGKMVQTQTLVGSQSEGSRFGTAISGLNDINGDSYYDIAVGAPYEDEGHGMVYIYNGYQGGFWPMETQRIKGRELNLLTFGVAISKPFLYNSDAYYDTLIGAFMSDKAVLIYSQPTINMDVTLRIGDTVTNDIIRQGTDTFTVEVCFSYQGQDLPNEAVVEFMIDIDTNSTGKRRRVVLESGNYNVSGSKIVQKALRQTCVLPPYTVLVQSHTDLFVPLVFSTTYKIRNDTVGNCLNNVCPMVNTFNGEQANPTITGLNTELTLQRPGCGEDNICQVDVDVIAKTKFINPDTDLIVGEKAKFELDVQMVNNGMDWAYAPFAEIEVPEYIDFVKSEPSDVACYKNSATLLVCQVVNPLKSNDGKHFNVKFDASRAPVKNFVISVNGQTISSDTNPTNNRKDITVSVRSKVNKEFRGDSFPEIYVTKGETGMKPVTHKFDFENNGPSALTSETKFVAKFPFLRIDSQDIFVLQQFIVVNVSSAINTSVRCWVSRDNVRAYMAVTSQDREGVVSHRFNIQDSFNFEVNSMNKDCQTDACDSFTCGVSPILAGFAVSMTMNFTLNPNTLAKVQASVEDVLKEVKISSEVTVDYPNDLALIEQEKGTDTQQATITVLPNKPIEEEVAWWVIFLSILGAVILIILIILSLWRCGFFKRKRPQKPEAVGLMEKECEPVPVVEADLAEPVNKEPPFVEEPVHEEIPLVEEPANETVSSEREPLAETIDETKKLVDNSGPDEVTGDSNKV
ncbi:integrin alpha-9-like isoform X2 [Mizuhopecten yessoensis]|uniref:Integrin alpha-9 n=1 Tax=Mizuhopecten yessoensis TaxID=6573 RepID=A0A210QG46_MIZYE|nr:integrin alpha-9-like isoform X2 [Mizuhopecten yessoensis]OWF47712.1 Integrin alpha-9 [Mizuhopecten yessoensis]